jgi:hypothetical protein
MLSTPLSQLIKVQHGEGEFSSKLISLVDRDPGAVLTKIEGSAPTPNRAYSSVQISENQDIELNSDLVYCNHSCDPSVIFDMSKFEIRVVAEKPLKKGDDVTFFYPSSEWNMQQPFECSCGSGTCLRTVRGAKYLDEATLRKYWLNAHIERLLEKRRVIGV